MSVTIKQIAGIIGCSPMTVSLVLNSKQYDRVSPRMRERVEAVAASMNYQPNFQAQALVSGKTKNIAITVVGMTPFYVEYVRHLTHSFEERGFNVFAFETLLNYKREQEIVNWTTQGFFAGCICLECNANNSRIYESLDGRFPLMLRGWQIPGIELRNILMVNYFSAIEKMFGHLAEQGYRSLGVVIDDSNAKSVCDSSASTLQDIRCMIYHQLVRRYNLHLAEASWIRLPADTEDGLRFIYRETLQLLERSPEVDGLIVQSANEIPAVYKAAQEAGRQIGKDLAVVTFDRIPLLDYLSPQVTHLYEPVEAIAEALTEGLLAQIGGKDLAGRPRQVFEAEIAVSDSSRRLAEMKQIGF